MNLHNLIFISIFLMESCHFSSNSEAHLREWQAIGFLGDSLFQNSAQTEESIKRDSLLHLAEQAWRENPDDLENLIWYGRRLAYTTAYRQAINIYSEGIKRYPDSPELYRHRGHRYISVRNLHLAIKDLKKAAELVADQPIKTEPDGIPNKLNIPLSNLPFNIYYHLGLAYYLQGNFTEADQAYAICMNYSDNADLLVATIDWWYMTKMRLGNANDARKLLHLIEDNLEIIENESYYKCLKFYQGKINASELWDVSARAMDQSLALATQGYGLGNYYFYRGQVDKARDILTQVVETGNWSAFGYIAAEADLARLNFDGSRTNDL